MFRGTFLLLTAVFVSLFALLWLCCRPTLTLSSLPVCSPGYAILGPFFELHVWRGVRSGCDQQRGFLSRFPGHDI